MRRKLGVSAGMMVWRRHERAKRGTTCPHGCAAHHASDHEAHCEAHHEAGQEPRQETRQETRHEVRYEVRVVGCVGLLTALLAVCGCSGTGSAAEDDARAASSGLADALEVIRQAADVLLESGSSQARTAMEMVSGGTRLTISGEGSFDYDTGVGELLLTLPAAQPAGAEPVPSEPVTEVFAPGELYMKNRGAGVPADKWVRVDVTTIADGNLVTGGATDPITAFELLRGASSVSDLGETELNGETVRHYRGVTDIAAAQEVASGVAKEQFEAAVAGEGFARTLVPFDVYIGEDGLPRKIRHEFSFAGVGGTAPQPVEVASTVLLFDFGTPVDVTMPGDGAVYSGTVS
ncbi:hypothetical protein [Streptomyces sp. B6B3]|uniref:hypothetical protein n=1 Tax=Streptomyces sp. B6B3 TaxID=3153570 RepID=UPI00325C71DB